MDDSKPAAVAVLEEQGKIPKSNSGFYETVYDEAKGFGKLFFQQLIGVKPQEKLPPEQETALKKEMDEKRSQAEYEQVRHKIMKMYEDQRIRTQQKEEARKQEEEQKKQQAKKLEELYDRRRANQQVAVAANKGSAETGRNWGAE